MTEMAFMTNHCNYDENTDITRKIKRMKLNNPTTLPHCLSSKNLPFNFTNQSELKEIFPFISNEVILSEIQLIQEIIKKSNNDEHETLQKLHSTSYQNFQTEKNFVNLHKSNKKRRFNALEIVNYENSHQKLGPQVNQKMKDMEEEECKF